MGKLTNNMFDVEQNIAKWRQRMLAAGITSAETLEELEGHLREEIERLMEGGLEPEAALNSAIGKLGQGRFLMAEFAMAGGVKMPIVLVRIFIAAVFLALIPYWTVLLFTHEMNWSWRLVGLADIALVGSAVFYFRKIHLLFPALRTAGTGFKLALISGILYTISAFSQFSDGFGHASEHRYALLRWALSFWIVAWTIRGTLCSAAKETGGLTDEAAGLTDS